MYGYGWKQLWVDLRNLILRAYIRFRWEKLYGYGWKQSWVDLGNALVQNPPRPAPRAPSAFRWKMHSEIVGHYFSFLKLRRHYFHGLR